MYVEVVEAMVKWPNQLKSLSIDVDAYKRMQNLDSGINRALYHHYRSLESLTMPNYVARDQVD